MSNLVYFRQIIQIHIVSYVKLFQMANISFKAILKIYDLALVENYKFEYG